MTSPTQDQLAQVKANVNNLMDFNNHAHDYFQDVINEVYDKLSEDPTYDPLQKFVSNMLDSAFWCIGSFSFPGAGVISSFVGTFFGAYAGPNPPPSLGGTFGDVWARFDATFLQADADLAVIYGDPAGNWNKSYTDPTTGKTVTVSCLGDGNTKMPGKDDVLFQQMTNSAVAAFRVALTKATLGKKWKVLADPKGLFMSHWDEGDIADWWPGFLKKNPAYFVTWHKDKGGSVCCPVSGEDVLENFLGCGSDDYYFAGQAPDDMCNWLFIDDQFGGTVNAKGIASREDVFCNWGLDGSLDPSSVQATAPQTPSPTMVERANWWREAFHQKPRYEIEQELIRRAWADPLFMRDLVKHPRETLAALGMVLPDEAKIEVIREKPGDYKLVIPWAGRPEQ
jgi:hypothetical protein